MIKYLLGFFICTIPSLRNYKYRLLSSWRYSGSRSFLDIIFYKCCFAWWTKYEFLRESDPTKREEMKSLCMGGEAGVGWAQSYQSRPLDFNKKVGNLSYRDACPVLGAVDRLLKSNNEKYTVIQIGSSSGREIAHIAKNNPNHDFIGTDTYAEVVKYSSSYHRCPNLSFIQCSAQDISTLLERISIFNLVLFSSNSLQYVQPEHLDIFIASCSNYPVRMLLLEPTSFKRICPEKIKESRWRGEFSYTHNYRYYAEKYNFETLEARIIKPYYDDDPVHAFVGHYYYYGVSNKLRAENLDTVRKEVSSP